MNFGRRLDVSCYNERKKRERDKASGQLMLHSNEARETCTATYYTEDPTVIMRVIKRNIFNGLSMSVIGTHTAGCTVRAFIILCHLVYTKENQQHIFTVPFAYIYVHKLMTYDQNRRNCSHGET